MPLTPYRDSFDPDALLILGTALDAAWQRLQNAKPDDATDRVRYRLAELIVRRAQSDDYDHDTLVDYALSNLDALSEGS